MTATVEHNLFYQPAPVLVARPAAPAASAIRLRDFQAEDVAAVLAAHQTHQSVLGRAATGLGKAMEIAFLAQHYSQFGRVMILVDVGKLVDQLAETIQMVTGKYPGIERADEIAHSDEYAARQPIIVSTVQTQYSGPEGFERYRKFSPDRYAALLLDECETFLADKAGEVVAHYMTNPALKVYGCSATPMRTDGRSMGKLFTHVAFDRDILWGTQNGWLVPARQAFVRVSLDFSTLKVRKGEDGERDFSEAEIAERINNERTLMELSQGIHHVCQDRKSIVVCPNVESAKALAHYLESDHAGCARCIYGEMSDRDKDDTFAGHKRGDFQYLVSVMMLTKGYDDKKIRAVVNCRKTRSKRLYQQIVGRGTRPWPNTVDGIEPAAARIAAIADSPKPDMLMVNMVGVEDDVRDITLVDILGAASTEQVRERAKRKMLKAAKDGQPEKAFDPSEEIETAAATERKIADDKERRARNRILVQGRVEVEYQNDWRVGGGAGTSEARIPFRQLCILRRAKVPERDIASMSSEVAARVTQKIVWHWKSGLCSYLQARELIRRGKASRQNVDQISYESAAQMLGWKTKPKNAGSTA